MSSDKYVDRCSCRWKTFKTLAAEDSGGKLVGQSIKNLQNFWEIVEKKSKDLND